MFLMYCLNKCDMNLLYCSLVRSLFMPPIQSVPMGKVISTTTLVIVIILTHLLISLLRQLCVLSSPCAGG